MNDVSTPTMNLLEKVLDVTAQRQQLVTANIANIDTPGYQTKDIDFHSELQRAVNGGPANFLPAVRPVQGLLERPDGNNVSMDREGLLLAETQMQFSLGVQLLHHEFQNLLSAISEGSKA
ncbi:MAG TPA: flagellar basal body protein [Terriglobales bacterium]|jgi:flagellar basal-body rod protein FlgB|nr:flagellar basal body protein [Terriglobales bacterium]